MSYRALAAATVLRAEQWRCDPASPRFLDSLRDDDVVTFRYPIGNWIRIYNPIFTSNLHSLFTRYLNF